MPTSLLYPRCSREELGGRFLGLMADLDPKGEGDQSMYSTASKSCSCAQVRSCRCPDSAAEAQMGSPSGRMMAWTFAPKSRCFPEYQASIAWPLTLVVVSVRRGQCACAAAHRGFGVVDDFDLAPGAEGRGKRLRIRRQRAVERRPGFDCLIFTRECT